MSKNTDYPNRIYIGYPCVGKTTIAETYNNIIDLESSLFFSEGERWENWHKIAVKMALAFHKAGFDIVITSHKDICDELANAVREGVLTTEEVVIIYPSLTLKDKWIEKIKQRYKESKLYTHKKAYENCSQNFDKHIESMMSYDCFKRTMITDLNYNLTDIIYASV